MEELKKFTGQSMNLDKNDKSLLPTETREVYNSITGRKGVFTRIEGNTLVNFTLPAGDNKVIGSCNDYSRHAILYFVKNSLGNHCILRVRGNKIDKVLWVQSVLNFKGRINHANTIGDLLYWTDGFFESSTSYNPPRKINMIRAIGSNNPFSHSGLVYEKFDVVHNNGKVYEFIGDTPGVFPLSDTDNWQIKGRVYDNLTTDRLYWILDRIKYPNHAQAPEVYYSDNVPSEPPPIIIDPPTTIPYGFLYNWDALFDVVPDPDGLELTFDIVEDVIQWPVADAESVSDWNTFFALPVNGTVFTSVVVDVNKVTLIGGGGITLTEGLFYENINLISVNDINGVITSLEASVFFGNNNCSEINLPNCTIVGDGNFVELFYDGVIILLPLVESVGSGCFSEINFHNLSLPECLSIGNSSFSMGGGVILPNIESISIPSVTQLGTSVGDNLIFRMTGYTLTLTVPSALMTCNSGSPDGDISYLTANNTVTIITV